MSNLYWLLLGGAALMGGTVSFFILRRSIIKQSGEVEAIIDQLLQGDVPETSAIYQDTLSGKLTVKLKRLSEMLNSQKKQSDLQHRQIQALIGDISHQLKTPVTNIKMLSETLGAGDLAVDKAAVMEEQLRQQVGKLDILVQEMLKASKLETGAVKIQPVPAPVINTVIQAVSGVALAAERKQLTLQVDCPAELLIKQDVKWTTEALFNILDNAVKYTPAKGWIAISCERWELYTKISIKDSGIGIAESEIAQIFQRFYRSQAVQAIDGVGIGLFLTREIIQRQGGYLKVTSDLERGTTFDVFLPNN